MRSSGRISVRANVCGQRCCVRRGWFVPALLSVCAHGSGLVLLRYPLSPLHRRDVASSRRGLRRCVRCGRGPRLSLGRGHSLSQEGPFRPRRRLYKARWMGGGEASERFSQCLSGSQILNFCRVVEASLVLDHMGNNGSVGEGSASSHTPLRVVGPGQVQVQRTRGQSRGGGQI